MPSNCQRRSMPFNLAGSRDHCAGRSSQSAMFADFNPIELCWDKVKQALHAAKARTCDDLLEALRAALLAVTPAHVPAWFDRCRYGPA